MTSLQDLHADSWQFFHYQTVWWFFFQINVKKETLSLQSHFFKLPLSSEEQTELQTLIGQRKAANLHGEEAEKQQMFDVFAWKIWKMIHRLPE